MAKGIWNKIKGPILPRSSHTFSVVGTKAYLFGGEIKPREPVSTSVHVFDLVNGHYEEVEGDGDVPDARVGHTAAVLQDEIYIFGGRGGAAMTPLEEAGSLHVFTPSTSTWRKIKPTGGNVPQARSYHCSTATSDSILVHAGCGNADVGRLNDLWSFNLKDQTWKKLDDAPGDPRGGSAIAYDPKLDSVWRFGGFNGKTEVGGVIDHLTLGAQTQQTSGWESIDFDSTPEAATTYPGARSVTGLHILKDGQLITFFGEGKPSPTGGHDAAGNFWGDIWLFDPKTKAWSEVKQEGDNPGERGWFSSDVYDQGVVVWGGLNGQNDRESDGWVLKLE